MLRTDGEPSQCSEEAERRVSVAPPQYLALPFLILGLLKALVRDGFRCVLTGDYNYLSPDQSTELDQEVMDSGAATSATECAHIFPQSIAITSGFDDKDAKVRLADPSVVAINIICSTSMTCQSGLS